MTLITKTHTEQLLANGRAQRAARDKGEDAIDFQPVVKLFAPDAQCTWLLTELDADTDLAFGLCDLGLGEPELGYVRPHRTEDHPRQIGTSRRTRLALRRQQDDFGLC
jgi:Protein of unknown function (DUF2958)